MGPHWIQVWVERTLWSPETSSLKTGSPVQILPRVLRPGCRPGPGPHAGPCAAPREWEVRVSLGLWAGPLAIWNQVGTRVCMCVSCPVTSLVQLATGSCSAWSSCSFLGCWSPSAVGLSWKGVGGHGEGGSSSGLGLGQCLIPSHVGLQQAQLQLWDCCPSARGCGVAEG